MGKKKPLKWFLPDATVTEDVRLWAAANLADMPVTIKFDRRGKKVSRQYATHGHMMRFAFRITVAPGYSPDFTIHLYKGASSDDLERAMELVEKAKAGISWESLWERVNFTEGYPGWWMRAGFAEREKSRWDKLRPCSDPNCVNDMHPWKKKEQQEPCTGDRIETESYNIELQNWRDGKGWEAYSSFDWELESEEDLRVIDRIRNDFAYMLGEAARLNASSTQAVAA